MMEEELRQEAEGYFETSCPYSYADTEDDLKHDVTEAYMAGAEPREKRIAELEETNERIASKYYELQETLKKVRVALIQERVANIMNYGNGGVEMFDDLLKMTEQEAD